MPLRTKVVASAALIAALGLGITQPVLASSVPQQAGESWVSQTPGTTDRVTRVPARVIRVFGNDYAQVELLTTGESRPIEFRYLGDTRRIIPGTYLIVDYDEAQNVVATEIVTEEEATALAAESTTVQTVETVESVETEAQVQPAPPTEPAPTAPAAQEPAPAQPVPALW